MKGTALQDALQNYNDQVWPPSSYVVKLWKLKNLRIKLTNDDFIIFIHIKAFEDFNKKALEECKTCGRTFLPRALEVHSRSKCKPRPEPANTSNTGSTNRNGNTR